MTWMLTGLSIATRGSHQSPISAAWRLVFDAAKRQPALPVQAIRPARMWEASTASPICLIAAIASSTLSSRTPEISRFCQTVRRISPSPRSRATLARPRICSQVILPSGTETPIQFRPSCFCLCTPICAMRSAGPRRKRLLRHARKRRLQLLLDQLEEAVMAHGVEHVFQPRLVAVGAVAMVDEHAHDGVGDGGCLAPA